jgi:hypothetical protein
VTVADHIGMHPAAAQAQMSRLTAAGERMTTGWGTTSKQVTDLAGQLGKGELGAAFLAGYQQPATETATAVEQCCALPGQYATTGTGCVAQYTSADNHGGQAINAAGQ